MKYTYTCPECGQDTGSNALHHVRQRTPCRPCIRKRNNWSCRTCGSSDPQHPSPCPNKHEIVFGKTLRTRHYSGVGETVSLLCTCGTRTTSKRGTDGAFAAYNKHVKRSQP